MAKIGISLNEVLRDYLGQFIYTFEKYKSKTDIKVEDITNFNLLEYFPFKDIDELNSFLYLEASLEIFGHADQKVNNAIKKLNELILEFSFENEHHIQIVSKEANLTIPATLFFLSKTSCKAENIKFVRNYADKWTDVDILITANPEALSAKPNNKISVKIKTPYNTNINSDYTLESFLDFVNDKELRDKILKPIITTNYEEVN